MKAIPIMSSSARAPLSRCMHHGAARGIVCAAITVLAGCASSGPAVHLHTLMPAEPPTRSALVAPGTAIPLSLDIRLPLQVEQPQLLVRLPDDSLMSLEQERWASPLRDEIRQAIYEELGARFGVVEARSAAGASPVRVAVEFRRFDSVVGKEARIEGAWSVSAGAGSAAPSRRCEWLYREQSPGAVSALPEAHRRAIVRLADAVGSAIVQPTTTPGACPVSDLR